MIRPNDSMNITICVKNICIENANTKHIVYMCVCVCVVRARRFPGLTYTVYSFKRFESYVVFDIPFMDYMFISISKLYDQIY